MSRGIRRLLRPLDLPIVLAGLLAASSAWIVSADNGQAAERFVTVTVAGEHAARWALPRDDTTRRDTVLGRLGPVVIETDAGGARVVTSGCPRQLCVHYGRLTGTRGGIVCAPNALLVTLEGGSSVESDPGLDGVTQ